MMWKKNLEETKQHYINWWNHKGIVLNMWEHFQEGVTPHADIPMPPAPESLKQKWFDVQWRADYLDWYVAHSSLMADMLPVANTQLGPGSLAAILGGVLEGGEDTIWIHPNPDYTDDIVFRPDHPNYLLHKQLLQACKQKAQGHYYVGMPDLMEGMDVLAAMKSTDKVLLDTVMQPDVLEHQMQQINDIYFKVFDELYDIIREGDEMAFCYFSSWAPGKMTKLQSDISTMISVEDYRRFVQPFIRQQCQKIDYTLYHLDGVGALHHLPALLEIEELNAVQWTPGVGEPQGGSPKWYDLYRRILDAGKSIMACWVTLDELRPLLDNIGGDGVHLEMDFHNEAEVEQAMRIVEDFQRSPYVATGKETDREVQRIINNVEHRYAAENSVEENAQAATAHTSGQTANAQASGCTANAKESRMAQQARQRMLVLDGAMGTMIQGYNLQEEDFRGSLFASHPVNLKGCNDLLCITKPEVVEAIHRKYLEAGADIIETNTFNAQGISMRDFQLHDHCAAINKAACEIARRVADEYTAKNPSKPRFVAGSMGPTGKTCSISSDNTQPGWDTFGYDALRQAYLEQAKALIQGGVDALLIETIFDTLNAKAAVEAAREAMTTEGRAVPIMLSFSVPNGSGRNMLGQDVELFVAEVGGNDILSVGINCCGDVPQVLPLLQRLGSNTPYLVSLYPNAGMPDRNGRYAMRPEDLRQVVWNVAQHHLVDIVGGCCGTTDAHIAALAQLVEPLPGCVIAPHGMVHTTTAAIHSPEDERAKEDAGAPHRHDHAAEPCECCAPSVAENLPSNAENPSPVRERIYQAILNGKSDDAAQATQEAIQEGLAPQDIINGEMIRAMSQVGQRFQNGEAFVPQLLMAGRAMKAALELLKPLLAGGAATTIGKVVIGTVKGDLHDIGKNLVASMLEGCGFEVINIGIDVDSDTFVKALKDNHADILCMSALLTTTMTYMREVIQALETAGIRQQVKVMVGGAPVTQDYADEIGADGYSDNANSAVAVAKHLMGK